MPAENRIFLQLALGGGGLRIMYGSLFLDDHFSRKQSKKGRFRLDDQHRECKTGGGAYFAFFFLDSDNLHKYHSITTR